MSRHARRSHVRATTPGDSVKDHTILMLADKLYICSRLLTCAAERRGWDDGAVQELVKQLRESTRRAVEDAGVEAHD